jgi:hypothetical protein
LVITGREKIDHAAADAKFTVGFNRIFRREPGVGELITQGGRLKQCSNHEATPGGQNARGGTETWNKRGCSRDHNPGRSTGQGVQCLSSGRSYVKVWSKPAVRINLV